MLRTVYDENKAYVMLPKEEIIDCEKSTFLSSGDLILAASFFPGNEHHAGKFIFYSNELRSCGVNEKDFVKLAVKHAIRYLSGYFHGTVIVTGDEKEIRNAILEIVCNNSYCNHNI